MSKQPRRYVRLAFIRELEAAVHERAHTRQTREHLRSKSWQKRIGERSASVRAHLDGLVTQAVVLVPDAAELANVRALLRDVRRTLSKAVRTRHRQFDSPAHRPDYGRFYAAAAAAMKAHRVGATETARVIVERIAPKMSDKARSDLLGPWTEKADQVRHLAENIRKRTKALPESRGL